MEIFLSSMLATFIIGLSYGASACLFTCIPTLGVVLLSQNIGAKETSLQTWRFNAGRICAYSLLTSVSGFVGASLVGLLEIGHANLIFAAMLLFSAVLLWRTGKAAGCSSTQSRQTRAGLFGMGFAMGLRPCAPLAGVIAASAVTGSAIYGLLLGLAYGSGAIVVPQLIFGYGMGRAGSEIRLQLMGRQQQLARIGASVLGFVGVGVGMGWVSL
ncbi:MAG: sulfite exporter TauE/SafE family protein [Mariprofundaceae bacterium]|nr:sulfite exporter TauE/SafE family protein [Mariprofundaceae bacterium]